MLTKISTVMILILTFYQISALPVELLGGMFSGVANCFKGIERDKNSEAFHRMQMTKDHCLKKHPDNTTFCYKDCVLQDWAMVESFQHPSWSDLYFSGQVLDDEAQMEEMVGNAGWNISIGEPHHVAAVVGRHFLGIDHNSMKKDRQQTETESEALRLENQVAKCKGLNFIVPRDEDYHCKDMAPETLEKLQKLIGCVEEALQLSTFPLGEKLAGIFPDVTNCFKGIKREFEDDQVKSLHTPKDGCIAANPDENSLCYKVCMLQLRGMLRSLDYPNMDDLYREHFQQNSSSGHEILDWTGARIRV